MISVWAEHQRMPRHHDVEQGHCYFHFDHAASRPLKPKCEPHNGELDKYFPDTINIHYTAFHPFLHTLPQIHEKLEQLEVNGAAFDTWDRIDRDVGSVCGHSP